MAKASAAVRRLEKAVAGQRKRASDLRKKIKTEQPMNVLTTSVGGYGAGWLNENNPLSAYDWAKNPELVFGIAAVAYGLSTSRSGQAEKAITNLGSGMLAVYAYKFSRGEA
jgi:hypothetical protein